MAQRIESVNNQFTAGLIKTLWILRDYLSEIVVGGEWAPMLYHRYLAKDKNYTPIYTRDIDFMVNRHVPLLGQKTVDQLLTEANFAAIFKSRDIPPLIHYEGTIDDLDVEIEFLTDQVGSSSEITLEVQEGLHAEALRFISIIIENVMDITIDEPAWIQNPSRLTIKVPSPAAYIFNKGLVFVRRRSDVKQAKDLYYIFDMLTTLSDLRPDIIAEFHTLSKQYRPWFATIIKNMSHFFETPQSDGVLLVLDQRPDTAFYGMDDDQLQQYIHGTFQTFLTELMKINISPSE